MISVMKKTKAGIKESEEQPLFFNLVCGRTAVKMIFQKRPQGRDSRENELIWESVCLAEGMAHAKVLRKVLVSISQV